MTEKSREKFVDLAEKRVTRAVRDIRLVGNLSNRSSYELGDDDVRRIFVVLEMERKKARERFQARMSGTGNRPFQLKI